MANTFTLLLLLIPLLFLPNAKQEQDPVKQVEADYSPPCNCTVTQGSFTAALPFVSSNTSAVNFYSYGVPVGASANTGMEVSETMLIMLYEDLNTGNTSLILILDQGNDGTGGNADITFNCMPSTSFVEFSDEPGELFGAPPTFTGAFNWAACCTDGGVIGGVGCGQTFTINPTINSGINAFSLVYGTPSNPIYVNMPQINCPITINCGGTSCCQESFEFSAVTQNASCENSANGSIDINTDCAAAPTFLWSTGATTEDLNGLNPGVYSVTITDANSCSQTASYVISADAPTPQPTIYGPTSFCAGEVTELGVSGFYSSYQWSNGSTSPSIFVTNPGIYTVTVTNANGCSGTTSMNLIENPVPAPNISGPSTICLFHDTITLNAGPGYTSYLWSTGSNSQTTDATEFGVYYVTVTNSFGCTGVDFTVVEPVPNPFPVITGPTNICSGNPISLNAGSGFTSYQWSNGATTQSITTTMQGNYGVTVTNADNCDGIAYHDVTQNPADTFLIFQTSCSPADTGVFVQSFVNQYGCDSLEILTVTLSESDSVFLFSENCNPQDTGVFIQTFTNQYGCDSLVIETVVLLPTDSLFFSEYSCVPQDTGTFVQMLTNQFGCDSVVTTSIMLHASDTVQIFAQSCDPSNTGVTETLFVNSNGCDSLVITTTSYTLADTTYIANTTCDPQLAGMFENLYTGTDGCDSLVITTISLLPSDTTYLQANTCDINQAGLQEQLLTNQAGCDSVVITNTVFISADTTILFANSCNPGDTGIFEQTLSNAYGCDSLIITTVSLSESDTTMLFETSCDPNQAGTEEVLLTNQFGCDSLLIVNTTYALADSTDIFLTTCDPSVAGVLVEIFMSSDGCDSVVTTTTTLLPTDTTYQTAQNCDPANTGISEMLLSNQFGCDSLVITTTTLLPSDTTYLTAQSCDISQAGISQAILPNQYGCDSLVVTSTTYIPPDTTQLFATSCDPNDVGTEVVILQNVSGCDSLIFTTTSLLPSDTTVLQAFSCDPGQVGTSEVILTNSSGCDSLIITHTAQLPVDTTWLYFGSCSTLDTGLIVTQLSNQYGCDSLVYVQTNLLPASNCQLDAQILGDTIGCSETVGSLLLNFSDGTPPYSYTWTDQNGNTGSGTFNQSGSPQQVSGLPPGAYSFEITDPNGLMTTLSAVIFQPQPLQINLQVNSDFNGYGISCHGASDGSADVTVLSGGLPPYSFNWSNGSQTLQANGLTAGWTSVTVTGPAGCTAIDSVFLESPDSLQLSLSVAHPDCFTNGLGAIAIDQVQGGNAPFQYALNGNNWQPDPLFDDLSSGNYQLSVEDANGCEATANAYVNWFTQPTVSLGPDLEMELGDSVVLQPVTNLPFSMLDSIYWGGLDCPECPSVTVAPVVTSTYSITIVDSLGCKSSDELQVVVNKNFNFYIPNAFTPDFNGINDKFTIYGGPQLTLVREFQIFDRWGEPVFTYFNFPPNDSTYGWDGSFRGKPMDAAVYVYFALLEFVDGSTRLVKGDVTLLR